MKKLCLFTCLFLCLTLFLGLCSCGDEQELPSTEVALGNEIFYDGSLAYTQLKTPVGKRFIINLPLINRGDAIDAQAVFDFYFENEKVYTLTEDIGMVPKGETTKRIVVDFSTPTLNADCLVLKELIFEQNKKAEKLRSF